MKGFILAFLSLSMPVWSQTQTTQPTSNATSSTDQNSLDYLQNSVSALQSGKPHFTSTPTFTAIAFGDGTTQTTAASVSTAASSAWSVSQSSFSVNYSTSVTFAISASTQPYILHWNIVAVNSPGELNWTFNGDNGANYDTQYHGVVENGGAIAAGDSVHTNCSAGSTGNSLLANGYSVGHYEFGIEPNNNHRANGVYHSFSNRASTNRDSVEGGCEYRGSAAVTFITMKISAGNFVGDVWLEKVNKQ